MTKKKEDVQQIVDEVIEATAPIDYQQYQVEHGSPLDKALRTSREIQDKVTPLLDDRWRMHRESREMEAELSKSPGWNDLTPAAKSKKLDEARRAHYAGIAGKILEPRSLLKAELDRIYEEYDNGNGGAGHEPPKDPNERLALALEINDAVEDLGFRLMDAKGEGLDNALVSEMNAALESEDRKKQTAVLKFARKQVMAGKLRRRIYDALENAANRLPPEERARRDRLAAQELGIYSFLRSNLNLANHINRLAGKDLVGDIAEMFPGKKLS